MKINKIYCTECPYYAEVIYAEEEWYGARCKRDGHSTTPSMYAIKSLHNDCPLTTSEIENDNEFDDYRQDVSDVLDEIRAEIMKLDYDLESVDYDYNDIAQTEEVHMICREEVLQILDKYKIESEDRE